MGCFSRFTVDESGAVAVSVVVAKAIAVTVAVSVAAAGIDAGGFGLQTRKRTRARTMCTMVTSLQEHQTDVNREGEAGAHVLEVGRGEDSDARSHDVHGMQQSVQI